MVSVLESENVLVTDVTWSLYCIQCIMPQEHGTLKCLYKFWMHMCDILVGSVPVIDLMSLELHSTTNYCYWSCFSDPLWELDIFISSGYRHTFVINVYISLYQQDILFVPLQFINTTYCQAKASKIGILAYINHNICHTTYLITFNISGWSLLIDILS